MPPSDERLIELPSRTDEPVAATAMTALGGGVGRHARVGAHRIWTPLRLLLVLAALAAGLAWFQKAPCRDPFSWVHEHQYTYLCYSDVTALYYAEGLNRQVINGVVIDGKTPYVDHPVEYPVVIGVVMGVSAKIAQTIPFVPLRHEAEAFFDITALLLAACFLAAVVLTARTARRRPWDAAMVALAPAVVIHAYTNWDLLAVVLASLAIYAWSRERTALAGVAIGLGTATKLYPAMLLVVLLVLCWRADRWRAWLVATGAAVASFTLVNVPVYLSAGHFSTLADGSIASDPAGQNAWLRFFTLNRDRLADWDSLWFLLGRNLDNAGSGHLILTKLGFALVLIAAAALAAWSIATLVGGTRGRTRQVVVGGLGASGLVLLVAGQLGAFWGLVSQVLGHDADVSFAFRVSEAGRPAQLNAGVLLFTALAVLAIAALAVQAPERPRLAQLAFLLVAGFLLVNKVDSPQYVLWLIPLAVLARPRWRSFLVWQCTELLVLLTRFMFFIGNANPGKGLGYPWFGAAIVLRDVALAAVMALVVRDLLQPDRDLVRADGADDPAGGVLDGAADTADLARAADTADLARATDTADPVRTG